MPPHSLKKIEIQTNWQNQPKFIVVYSRNNLPKIKKGVYVINLCENESILTNWITFYVIGDNRRTS